MITIENPMVREQASLLHIRFLLSILLVPLLCSLAPSQEVNTRQGVGTVESNAKKESYEQRIRELERKLAEIEYGIGGVEMQDLEDILEEDDAADNKVEIGGWLGVGYIDNDKQGTKPAIDAHPIYVYLKGEPVENWRYFAEIEAEHAVKIKGGSSHSTGAGEIKVERLYIEHEVSDAHKFRLGKIFTPFGYWYRLHWHFLTETLSRPISFNNAYVPRQQVGLQYFGRVFLGDKTTVDYFAWAGDGPDTSGTNNRSTSVFSVGGSVYATHELTSDISLGATVGYHQQNASLKKERNGVAGMEIKIPRTEIRAEGFYHARQESDDWDAWYLTVIGWVTERAAIVYRYDGGDDVKQTKSFSDHRATSQSIGYMWRPYPQLLIKGEYKVNRFQVSGAEDFDEWNMFFAIKF